MRYHYTPNRIAKIQNTDNTKCWQRCGAKELSFVTGGLQNGRPTLGDSLGVSYKTKYTFTPRSRNYASWHLPKWTENVQTPAHRWL